MNLPEKLVSLRKEKGLTQMKLAEILDVSRQAVSRWEVGDAVPSTENLKCLGKLYGIPMDYLLDDTAEREQESPITEESSGKRNRSQIIKRVVGMAFVIIVVCISVVALRYFSARQEEGIEAGVSIEKMEEAQLEAEPEISFDFEW